MGIECLVKRAKEMLVDVKLSIDCDASRWLCCRHVIMLFVN